MNIKFKNIFFIIILLTLFSSCSKDIVLPDDNIEDSIAIFGCVSSEKDTVHIEISEINKFIGYVPNAIVRLYGNDSIYTFHYSDYQRRYISDKEIKGEVGQAYTLEVIYNEKKYTATDTMPQYPSDEYNLPFYIEKGWLACNYYNFGFQNTNEWYGYSITPDSEGCYSYFGTITIEGSVPQGYFNSISYSSALKDTLVIYKYELSEAYINYKMDVLNVKIWNDNIFSVQADNIRTNVTGGGYGFFAAKSVIHKRGPIDEFLIIEK